MSRLTQHRHPCRVQPPSLARRVGVAVALAAALLLCPLPASGGLAWDTGIAMGYLALVVAATLYLFPLRGAGLPHRRLFTLSQHRRIGWVALILGLLHTAILLVSQPLVGHYLLPSAPLYMLLGLAGLIALAILVATGLSARSALRKASAVRASPDAASSDSHILPPRQAPPASVTTHAILAAFLLTLIAAHILGSHQLADRPAKVITVGLLLGLPLVWAVFRIILRRRVREKGSRPTHAPIRLLPTLLPNGAAAVILFLLPIPTATPHLLQPAMPPSRLPVYFPHEKHTTVNCVTCHHNFVDKTGVGSCLDCHQTSHLTEAPEATFHTFCRTCHADLAQTTRKHGPTRACSACHTKEAPPTVRPEP
jgi:Class III cytochrome C family